MLRRNLKPSDLLSACLEEWKKTAARRALPGRLQQVEAIVAAEQALPARQRNPVQAYRRVCAALENPDLSRRKVASPPAEPLPLNTNP